MTDAYDEAVERLIARAPEGCPSCLHESRLPPTDPNYRDPHLHGIGTVDANYTRLHAREGFMGFTCGHNMPVKAPVAETHQTATLHRGSPMADDRTPGDALPPSLVELADIRQWVTWKRVPDSKNPGKPRKLPRTHDGRDTGANEANRHTWSTYREVHRGVVADRGLAGVGFVFTTQDDYVGVDLDKCGDRATGQLEPWALDIVDRLDSYTEWSPSGTGVHILCRGVLPPAGSRRGRVEMYDQGRYFTVTGWGYGRFGDRPITERIDVLAAVHAEHVAPPAPTVAPAPVTTRMASSQTDDDLWSRMFRAKNGDKIRRLYDGDTSGHLNDDGTPDHSDAVMALVGYLAWWTGRDAIQTDRMFRQSRLYADNPKKWDRLSSQTVGKAIATVTEGGYTGSTARDRIGDGTTFSDRDASLRMASWNADAKPELDAKALHGLAGDVVRLVDPHTEADPAAVLASFIVAFGNAVGTRPHHMLGAETHHARAFALIVGTTGTGRKGASWAPIRELMTLADGGWSVRIRSGLSSGEGLIAAVADEASKDDQDVVKVTDRRLLAIETEFSKPLRSMRREGNTLSAVIRDAWDHGNLATITRSNSIATTGAHISIVGHITPAELEKETSANDASNGFLNRFLFVLSRRSKFLSRPEPLDGDALHDMSLRVRRMLDEARRIGRITWHPETTELWDAIYGDLSGHEADEDGADDGGLAGLLLNRREAHVLRLSMLYALMDGSDQIRLIHLEAAVELWWYCEQSVRTVFGDASADAIQHRIWAHLQKAGRQTRTDISNLLGRHVPSARIDAALQAMVTKQQIVIEKADTGGRPVEMLSAITSNPPTVSASRLPDWLRKARGTAQ